MIALFGCGYWGKNLARNFHQLGSLSLIVDPSEQGKENASNVAPGIPVVPNFDFQSIPSEIKGVAIATPAVTHFGLAKKALQAGLDVFTEKPLALKFDEGKELLSLAESKGRILAVGHVLEYHPAFLTMLELIRAGEIGKLCYIYSNRLNLGKVRTEENILWSFAPHDIALILRITGRLPLAVFSSGGSYIQTNIYDVTMTNLLFDNGVRGHIHVSWLHPFKEQRMVVVGSEKMISFDDVNKKLLLYNQKVEIVDGIPTPSKGDITELEYPAAEPLKEESKAFLKAIDERKGPVTDGQSGLDVLQVLQAAQSSLALNGQPVTLIGG